MKHLRCLIEAPGGAKKEHPKANFFSLGGPTLGAKHLYDKFSQYWCRFKVISGWEIRIWQNLQDQAPLGSGTVGAKIYMNEFWGEELKFDEIIEIWHWKRPVIDLGRPEINFIKYFQKTTMSQMGRTIEKLRIPNKWCPDHTFYNNICI
jgi:hypothetical protein